MCPKGGGGSERDALLYRAHSHAMWSSSTENYMISSQNMDILQRCFLSSS